eukprot:1189024-Prorocentrum_minimum.AAC.1
MVAPAGSVNATACQCNIGTWMQIPKEECQPGMTCCTVCDPARVICDEYDQVSVITQCANNTTPTPTPTPTPTLTYVGRRAAPRATPPASSATSLNPS